MKKAKRLIILITALFFIYGCGIETVLLIGLGAGGGIAGYKYIEGHSANEFPLGFANAWDATNTALENLRISVVNSDNDGTKGTIKAFNRDGKEISIKLKARSKWVTTINVRAGRIGSRDLSERILDEIASVAGL